MASDTTVLLTLALIGAAAVVWYSWRAIAKRRQKGRKTGGLTEDYIEGLNFLLNDQPDRAIDVFMRLLAVDSDTLETHFALGSLFRKRGEVDRAIRIHQNVIARPALSRRHKQAALLALADDFVSAGLYDRAEGVLHQLADAPELRRAVLDRLARIYESQKDWTRAIRAREQLQTRGSDDGRLLAHYYCELASGSMDGGRPAEARAQLKRAQSQHRSNPRSALMRADIAIAQGDERTALRLLRRVVEGDARQMRLVLPRLDKLLNDPERLNTTLAAWVRKRPELTLPISESALFSNIKETSVIVDAFRAWLEQQPSLAAFCGEIGTGDVDESESVRLLQAFRRLLVGSPQFHCVSCGFEGSRMYWQCPGCQRWDSVVPNPVRVAAGVPKTIAAS